MKLKDCEVYTYTTSTTLHYHTNNDQWMFMHCTITTILYMGCFQIAINTKLNWTSLFCTTCNEAISLVTQTLLLIWMNLLFTLIKEITTSIIAYNCTHIHIFTICSLNRFCLLVHLYCTILYCHPLYLCCEVQLSCMFVSFTCPSPLLYSSLCPCNPFHL